MKGVMSVSPHSCISPYIEQGFPDGSADKESTCNAGDTGDMGLDSWVRKILWRKAWQPIPAFLLGESHEQRSLAGYNPKGLKELDRPSD